jgi:hypothetical protein
MQLFLSRRFALPARELRYNVTKLLASSGAVVGTYPAGNAMAVAFDGANLWVANYASNSVTKIPVNLR